MHRVTDTEWSDLYSDVTDRAYDWASENMGPNSIEYSQYVGSADWDNHISENMESILDDLYWEVGGWIYYDEAHPAT